MKGLIVIISTLAIGVAGGYAATGVEWSSSSSWTARDRTAAILELHSEVSDLGERLSALESTSQADRYAMTRSVRHLGRCVEKVELAENGCAAYWFAGGFAP